MTTIDTCGLSCPQPVLMVLQYVKKENPTTVHVLVDNEAAEENITRAGENNGYTVMAHKKDTNATHTILTLNKS